MQTISRLFENSAAAEFGLTLEDFAGLFNGVIPAHLDELILARACARGNEPAWEKFIATYRPKLYAMAIAITRDDCAGRNLADSLYAELYGSGSKFAYYSGKGSLEGWLRTLLAQEHVNGLRRERRSIAFDDSVREPASASSRTNDAADQARLDHAIDRALEDLDAEQRFLLAAYYLDARTLAEIGGMLRVHESTVSRRLDGLVKSLRKSVVSHLRTAGVTAQEAEGLLCFDVRDVGVDVRARLVQGRQA